VAARGWTADDPAVTVDPISGLVNIIARGTDKPDLSLGIDEAVPTGEPCQRWLDRSRARRCRSRRDGCTGGGHLPRCHAHLRARSEPRIYHGWKDARWHWEASPGIYSGNPDVFQFGDQLQTVGRGLDGVLHTLWYDPLDGQWNAENHDVSVTD